MKFAEHLSAHITPEWRKQYIEYEKMKRLLYDAQEAVPAAEETDPAIIERYFAKFHENFFRFCDQQLKKINIFFSEKLAECMRKLASLKADLEQSMDRLDEHERVGSLDGALSTRKKRLNTKTHHEMVLAYSEFYLSLILLQNYQMLNFTGFRKILKKHDKLFETKEGAEWRQSNVETSIFFTSKDVASVIEQVENIVTNELEGGDRGKAMKRLRVPPLGEKQNPLTTFRVGLFLGIMSVLLVIAVISMFYVKLPLSWQISVRLYRGPLLIILFLLLIGGNTYGWGSSGVNHVLIFELDPRHHLTYQQFLEAGGFFAVVWGLSLIVYLFSPVLGIPLLVNPLWMAVFMLAYLLNPLPVLHHQSRRWLLTVLFRMSTAPFHHVAFAHFWMADQFNSLAVVLVDMQYFICFYATEVEWFGTNSLNAVRMQAVCDDGQTVACSAISPTEFTNPCVNSTLVECSLIDRCHTNDFGIRPLVTLLPAWWRFAQCWRRYRDTRHAFPHVVNAFKYSTSFLVVTFSCLNTWYKDSQVQTYWTPSNVFFWLWLLSAIVSSCYTFAWDIKMDWGLLDRNAGENRLLREETVYRYRAYYYLAMLQDLLLRFSWTITMTVSETGVFDGEIVKTCSAVLEVLRRFIWNFFRLENEHLNNCGEFRAVRDISITPIDHSDQVLLEKMMDEEDGVTNRLEQDAKKSKPGGLRRRDTKTWFDEEDEEQTDTWTAFKGGVSSWLQGRRRHNSMERKVSGSSIKAKER
ncbi:solute carrier family 53 member 1-like isoform X2 [Watersipora subatra]|uniref:solute carrier family 53 member 1-like isoform X2 n=1 Tax=Watersipora subatra TaxID=2589382 RepID=UPI00355C1401